MPWQNPTGYALNHVSLLAHAPAAPGVYAIYSGKRWVYFGESEDLRRRLLEHLTDRSHCMHQFPDLQYSVELAPNRVDRLQDLLRAYPTPCNSRYE